MKIALKLLLWYLGASFIATCLSLALVPHHAHVPGLALLLVFPMHPYFWVLDCLDGRISTANAMALGIVVVSMGYALWHHVTSQRKLQK